MITDLIQYTKKQFGVNLISKKSLNPDTFQELFGFSTTQEKQTDEKSESEE